MPPPEPTKAPPPAEEPDMNRDTASTNEAPVQPKSFGDMNNCEFLGAIQRVDREFEMLHGYLHTIALDKVVCRSVAVRPRILGGLHLRRRS